MSPADRLRLRGLLQWALTHMHQLPDPVLERVLHALEGIQHQLPEKREKRV